MNDTRHLDIPYLTALREELLRGAARSNRRRRRMLLASRIAVLAVALAGAATAGFSLFGGRASGTQNADAALLQHVRLAVTPPRASCSTRRRSTPSACSGATNSGSAP